ncbi:hypothetical protein ACIPL1_09825 [Pseudomonas sp. NPDC090202]|uniref:hypothetical protein n=1 Tax=unclassified Pseudomonas TaxID=196821 RepID=UPI00382418D7
MKVFIYRLWLVFFALGISACSHTVTIPVSKILSSTPEEIYVPVVMKTDNADGRVMAWQFRRMEGIKGVRYVSHDQTGEPNHIKYWMPVTLGSDGSQIKTIAFHQGKYSDGDDPRLDLGWAINKEWVGQFPGEARESIFEFNLCNDTERTFVSNSYADTVFFDGWPTDFQGVTLDKDKCVEVWMLVDLVSRYRSGDFNGDTFGRRQRFLLEAKRK